MKTFKYLLIMVLTVSLSVACSDDDEKDGGNSSLIGSWEVSESIEGIEFNITATFNKNLSGTIVSVFTFEGETETETENFTWSTDGNKLTLVISGDTEVSTYSISGDKLTITDSEGFTTVLTRK
mgnify:CR=1 FL=1